MAILLFVLFAVVVGGTMMILAAVVFYAFFILASLVAITGLTGYYLQRALPIDPIVAYGIGFVVAAALWRLMPLFRGVIDRNLYRRSLAYWSLRGAEILVVSIGWAFLGYALGLGLVQELSIAGASSYVVQVGLTIAVAAAGYLAHQRRYQSLLAQQAGRHLRGARADLA